VRLGSGIRHFSVREKMVLINPDEVVTGALVNAVAVVGRRISKAAAGLRKTDEGLATVRWFETFRVTEIPPDLPGIFPGSWDRLTEVLRGDEIQAALQELLAARLTDAPETDASRARDTVRVALSAADTDAAAFGAALADYYDDQICVLVARLEAEEPPLLAQIRSEAFSSRMISILHSIERHAASLAEDGQRGSDGRAPGGPPATRLLAEVTDPFALEVHRPVQVEDAPPGLPVLPMYVPREHDWQLAEVVRAAAEGASGIAVLVGASSTGKTRACWEALGLLRKRPERWRLWHPIDPSRPEAALRDLRSIGPRTVVWLNEAQFYLDVPVERFGEKVAAGLRELLRDPDRAPVLVLATLWPQFWDRMTSRPPAGQPDLLAQARDLLSGQDISVPAAFTGIQLQELAAVQDPRLAQAAAASPDGRVVQFLAGAPELLARYRNAPSAAAALLNAAIDARRLGMGIALPLGFLEMAAPAYLTDADRDELGEDWLEQALAYTAATCNGIRGPLARLWPRPGYADATASAPVYRLSDYLDQHGRHTRRSLIPSADFWTAAACFSSPGDLLVLARAAEARGLLRDAARLRKRAAADGNTSAATELIWRMHYLHPGDPAPAQWAAAHAALADPGAVARLLGLLRRAGADQQAKTLAARAAAHVALADPGAVAILLDGLREAAADDQTAALLARDPAAHVALDDPGAVAILLDGLREAAADDQTAALLARDPAAHAALDDPIAVARLLDALRRAGADQQAKTLAARAAARAALDDPIAVARLMLDALYDIGADDADDQTAALLARDPAAHVALDDPGAVARLLDALRRAGADDQTAALLARDPAAHAALDDPIAVARLLDALRRAGADDQTAALLARDPAAHVALDDPIAVARLLDALREAGADDQTAALLARDPAAHAALDRPAAVASLLDALRRAGAGQQAKTLTARAALDDPGAVARLLDALRRVGADDQTAALLARDPAAHAALDRPAAVARLLDALRRAGAGQQAKTLAARAAARAALDDPGAVARLLDALREAGADDQTAALLARDPAAHAALDRPAAVRWLLYALRKADANAQVKILAARAAAQAEFNDKGSVDALMSALCDVDAEEQINDLLDKLPAEGRFDLFRTYANQVLFRFGREVDGSPSPAWGWDDLD
jgi:uncharacterized protein YidB (DUF937 family)